MKELSRLKEMRLAQLPKIIASLQQEINNSRREVFGALGQAYGEDSRADNNKSALDEPPSESLLLRLEEELKQIRAIEEHCEPICIAIRRYNEVVALQEELRVIMSDKTRLTSKSRRLHAYVTMKRTLKSKFRTCYRRPWLLSDLSSPKWPQLFHQSYLTNFAVEIQPSPFCFWKEL